MGAVGAGFLWGESAEVITVSKTSRTAGAAYERIRNAVDYEEEHLLRRNAIRRIVMRRVQAMDKQHTTRGEALLTELIWAKYLPNKKVPLATIGTIDAILDRYDRLFEAIPSGEEKAAYEEWLFDVLSTEIEYTVEPPRADEALAGFMFERVKRELVWEADKLEPAEKDMLLYGAIYRALLKSNPATLRYRMLTLYFPHWAKATKEQVEEVAGRLPALVRAIESHIQHPLADQLYRRLRRYVLVFWVIKDIIKEHPEDAGAIFKDQDKLSKMVKRMAETRYDRFRTRRTRTVARAVLFLFLTKMLLALIIEVPYEYFFLDHLALGALAINILFHPVFLSIIGMTVTIPAKRNTDMLTKLVSHVIADKDPALNIVFKVKKPWTQGLLGQFFTVIYTLTYLFSYGVIAWFLSSVLSFNVVSVVLFLFFFSLVTFFGIKIRQSVQELLVVERQGSVIGTLFDFFLLPIVRAGRWISLRARKLNVFAFFLDYIAEAPIKLGIEMVESWTAFVKAQKEELE